MSLSDIGSYAIYAFASGLLSGIMLGTVLKIIRSLGN